MDALFEQLRAAAEELYRAVAKLFFW